MMRLFLIVCSDGRLCPPTESSDPAKGCGRFDTFQGADRVIGPYAGSAF